MLYKKALCETFPLNLDSSGKWFDKMVRTAAGVVTIDPGSDKARIIEAEIKKHPTALFFRAKAIKADEPNSNGDYFSVDELTKAYKSFEGVPFFTNHNNQNVENARGKIIHAEWIPEEKSVYTLAFVDREAFPHICRSIEEEYITGVSMGAISGNSLITMGDLSEKMISEIKEGDYVLTPYGNKKIVNKIHGEYLGKPMYSYDLSTYHRSPKFTDDHPVFMMEGALIDTRKQEAVRVCSNSRYEQRMGYIEESVGQDAWRYKDYNNDAKFTKASKIQKGDYLLVPSKFKIEDGASANSDFYYVVGAYLGDGYLKKDKKGEYEAISFCIGLDEIELAKKITKTLKKYSKSKPCDLICENRNGLYISLYDRKLAKWFADNVGTGSKTKRIKFNLSLKEDALNLIAGYLDTDGCISVKTNTSHTSNYQFSSANIGLLEDIQSLLISMNCVSRISSFNRIPSQNSVVKINTIEHTLSVGSNNSNLFGNSIKFTQNDCRPAKIKAGKTFVVNINGNKFMACPVKDIYVEDFKEPVYDLTVDGDECYIADGIGVHNCSVEYSICNICGNKAEKTEDYCSHIKERKGRTFSGKARNVVSGEVKDFKNEPVFEYNYGIKFIELSAVVDPACSSCRIQGLIKNDDIIKKVANIQNSIYVYKSASMIKEAGQQEITQLNEVLKTLEQISVQLIQNRQQVEVEFASDLVGILSELQTFVDELVGAGYGSVQNVPGVGVAPDAGIPGAASPQIPTEGLPVDVQPVAAEAALPTPPPSSGAGTVSGSPTKPIIQSPKLPITSPAKPRASSELGLKKVANLIENIRNLIGSDENTGDEDMTKRRTVAEKAHQKNVATEVLSNSWQEKQEFFEYISKVPSIQDNESRLSVKKRDNSFIIVAESKGGICPEMVWTYDTLSDEEKKLVKESPKEASVHFLGTFSKTRSNLTKEGDQVMSKTKEAGARSVNKEPDVIQEAQLEEKGLYHSRTNDEKNVVTQSQLSDVREDSEKDVITEAQLQSKSNKLNPRTEKEADVVTEAQLRSSEGPSPRTEDEANVVTQKQLEDNGNRTGTDPDVITQKQLDSVDTPWARAAKRNASQFKSAGDHMQLVLSAVADAAISTGCTPEELCTVGGSLISSTKDRFELGNAILDESKEEAVDYSKRLAYWSKKNVKVAGAGSKEIAESIIKELRKVANDVTTNPDTVIDALDVLTEGEAGVEAISNKIDEKMIAASKANTVKVSKKDELRKALLGKKTETKVETKKEASASKKDDGKLTREAERAIWLKSLANKDGKVPDTMIVTNFEEVGCGKKDPTFKSVIKSFAKGALASKNVKLAAITNVTISGDTISIAVQTEGGEEGVEIPVGEEIAPASGEEVPEGDFGGEGLENSLGTPPEMGAEPVGGISPQTGLPLAASAKSKLTKKAQIGGGAPAAPGAGAVPPGPGAPSEAGLPTEAPQDTPIQSLTTDETSGVEDEIPTAGEQQPPWTICPECGSSNVDVENSADIEASIDNKIKKEAAVGGVKGKCNDCGAEYEALVKKTFEFIITKPTKSVGNDETAGEPEVPEVPALPVAAQTRLDKGTLVRVASNKKQFGHVCPACGMRQCKASKDEAGHTEYHCPACGTDVEKDVLVNVNQPKESVLRVKWNIVPKLDGGCKGCKEAAKKFAASIKVEKMMKSASESKFPMANCIERIARKFGGNAVATFGPCKGKALADCVCGQLEKLGMTKVRHMEKLASVYSQKDPMDECIEDQVKKNYTEKEAKTICNCLKKKFASKEDENPFLMAFADDIASGKEKILTAQDLDVINDSFVENVEEVPSEDIIDEDIGDDLPTIDEVDVVEEAGEETVLVELSKDTAEELAQAAQSATADVAPEGVEAEGSVEEVSEVSPVESEPEASEEVLKEEMEMATAMQTHKLRRVGEEVIKVAAKPTKVKDIEGNVEAGVPRSEQKLGEESKADSLMNKPNKGPDVPRANAYMGKEKEADSLINSEPSLPDVAVDSAYMGHEKEVQKGMPAINNEIKGTVIADTKKNTKEAKKMKEVETVEKDVEAGVPRNEQKLGEEAKADSLMNEPNKGPDVPRSKAYMGKEKEADSLINSELSAPDVPIDSAYMGHEKEVQKDMPGINDEMLKTVQMKKEVQIERIAAARRMKAVEVTAKLLATGRIQEEAYDNVIEALSKFQIDKISSVAENMYPKIKRVAAEMASKDVHAGPAIVMESKPVTANASDDLMKRIASQFTIGNKSFDEKLTQYGEK